MSEQEEKNNSLETEKNGTEREEINDILDRFQQKWGMKNSQVAKEIGVSDVSLSYAKNGKRSGTNILTKLRKLADSYDLFAPAPEEEQSQKEQLQLVQKLYSKKIHPKLLQWAYEELGFEPGLPFLSFLGDEGVVKLALHKHAQGQKFLEFMFAPRQSVPQLPAPASQPAPVLAPAPAPALSSPRNTITIIEEPVIENNPPVSSSRVIRWCQGCGINIRGNMYEVPTRNPTYGHEYDYYCEQCGQQNFQAQKRWNPLQRRR